MRNTIRLIIIGLVALSFTSCNNSKVGKEIPKLGQVKILAVYKDSGRVIPSIIIRQISKQVKIDSLTGKESIVTDTLYGVEVLMPTKDTSGKVVMRLLPKVISKDSVNWHIQNIALDSLLDIKTWKQ